MLPYHRQLPSAPESLYEVGRAFEKHPPTVIKALKAGTVTSLADARDVRKRADINAPKPARRKPRRFSGTHLTAAQRSHTPVEFVKFFKKHDFTFVCVVGQPIIDSQAWGKVYRARVLATNVQRVKDDGSIPKDVSDKHRALLNKYLPK
jgi:hypothetical protein